MKRCAFVVHGRVQGVGFRHFAQKNARVTGVSGWVRNDPDGTVRGEAEGEALELFLTRLREGPPWGRVDRLDVDELEPSGGTGFEVRH